MLRINDISKIFNSEKSIYNQVSQGFYEMFVISVINDVSSFLYIEHMIVHVINS